MNQKKKQVSLNKIVCLHVAQVPGIYNLIDFFFLLSVKDLREDT